MDFKTLLKKNSTLRKHYHLMRRRFLHQGRGFPDWQYWIEPVKAEWQSLLQGVSRQRVLIGTGVGSFLLSSTVESMLAVALTLRQARVSVVLCDGILPACLDCLQIWFPKAKDLVRRGPQRDLCSTCYSPARQMYESLGIDCLLYSDLITTDELLVTDTLAQTLPINEIENYLIDDIPVGEHALAGALRYFARGTLDGEPFGEKVYRQYFRAALITTQVYKRLFTTQSFDTMICSHGIYVPMGLAAESARRHQVHVVAWNIAYRENTFIFSHDGTYHHTLMNEATSIWDNMPWTSIREQRTVDYLKSRWQGSKDWITFVRDPQLDLEAIRRAVPFDWSKPVIGLLTNVVWDAQLHYPQNAFPHMVDWILQTVSYFANRTDLQLIIRIHPAEVYGAIPSRQPVLDELKRAFLKLPDNVFVVVPESHLSTYKLMEHCNAVIIYGTKSGVELTSMGIPIIVAGEAWIRNKGLTTDISDPQSYFRVLDRLPFRDPMEASTITRARKYAYHFFFRRMIPLPFVNSKEKGSYYELHLKDIFDLKPGRHRGLDVICNGILSGSEFVYDE